MFSSILRVFLLANLALMASATLLPRQFNTSPCNVSADCNSGCCGVNSGKCEDPIVASGGCR
ncbi:hypothetical protein C8J57DRAFT_1508197 [Mycena rebaudengoi]|nr:hypothetical protein C8J57DRAFT_1508197 [Mycena rebaudengoi]